VGQDSRSGTWRLGPEGARVRGCDCQSVRDIVRDRRATPRAEGIGRVREQECIQMPFDFFAEHRL